MENPIALYRYRLRNTHESSDRFGACEVCNKHVSEVWLQTEERQYIHGKGSDLEGEIGWTHHNCFRYFGHLICLESKQRSPKQ